jgi:hypothetical protein
MTAVGLSAAAAVVGAAAFTACAAS